MYSSWTSVLAVLSPKVQRSATAPSWDTTNRGLVLREQWFWPTIRTQLAESYGSTKPLAGEEVEVKQSLYYLKAQRQWLLFSHRFLSHHVDGPIVEMCSMFIHNVHLFCLCLRQRPRPTEPERHAVCADDEVKMDAEDGHEPQRLQAEALQSPSDVLNSA